MSGADLSEAYLRGAYLSGADLEGANLEGAHLNAHLIGADLRATDLSGAMGWTEDQLSEALSLDGAIMPNGQNYEDWLKSKGRGGEDGENGSPS